MIPDIRKLLGSLTLAGAGAMLAACGGGTGTAASGTAAPGINVPTPPTVTAAQTPATTSAVTNQQVDSENGMKVGQNKAINSLPRKYRS